MDYVEAWENTKREWSIDCVKRAINSGDVAVWRLLGDMWKKTSRPIVDDNDSILTDPNLIEGELLRFHESSNIENSSTSPGGFEPVNWKTSFSNNDEVLVITDEIVFNSILRLKNSSVPDNMTPALIKLMFGEKDLVYPVGELIRAVARTRCFPDGGKVAKQIFCWKGVGLRNKLENCHTITMANILLKLAESCIKISAMSYWEKAGFPRSFWGHFFGAPASIYVWLSTVEKYVRSNLSPETALTDVSRAFDRVHHELDKKKLYDFGLPRQLIELVIELISGIKVSLSWGDVKTRFVERGNTGVSQGSLEGMWNFGIYSDNIQDAITRSAKGILVGNEIIRAVTYADDISPVNNNAIMTNKVLEGISEAGTFNAYKFKPSKCKNIGSSSDKETVYRLCGKRIERAKCGILLGVVIEGRGILAIEHIKRRAEMVRSAIKLIKSWRTKGLPFRIAFKHLFVAKLVPRFTYAFALLQLEVWGKAHELIRKTLEKALCSTFGWSVPKKFTVQPGIWSVICGYPTVSALLRKLKLDMAARLKVGENRAGRIFRSLYLSDRGSFENDVHLILKEWLLLGSWGSLTMETLACFKRKVSRISKKCWPRDVDTNGNLTWLYHNHRAFSGNVPMWADWEWPKGENMNVFRLHFNCLLIGHHPAAGSEACCSLALCGGRKRGPVYNHHYFECADYTSNYCYFRKTVKRMYRLCEAGASRYFGEYN